MRWWMFYPLAALSVLLYTSAGAMVVIAIWTVGPDSTRWALTGCVVFVVAMVVSYGAAVASDEL